MDADHEITRLIEELRDGDDTALKRLMPLVYDELRRIACRQLNHKRAGHTLNTTGLAHEAYLRLGELTRVDWRDRIHFFAVAARAMRQILIDRSRRRNTAKRGGGWQRIPIDEADLAVEEHANLLLALDESLTRLATLDERLSRVVEYRFFGGMTEEEVAAALGITDRTVRRDWQKAKLWLYADLVHDESSVMAARVPERH